MKEITVQMIADEILIKKSWDIDPGRLARAVEISSQPRQIYNQKCPPGSFDVRGSAGGWYRVDTINKTCSCTDSSTGHICKHRLAVYLANEQINRTHAALADDAHRAILDEQRARKEQRIVAELGY